MDMSLKKRRFYLSPPEGRTTHLASLRAYPDSDMV